MPDPQPNADLSRTRRVIELGMAEGLHTGAQLFATLRGQPVVDLSIGESRPGVPMTRDTLVLWLSSTKPVVAACILQLVERGSLQLDWPVARLIPEFGVRGKEPITVRHLLTHTGGFRWADTDSLRDDWDTIIAKIAAMPLERGWTIGSKAGYHPFTSWYILGELIHRADGRPLPQYVRAEIFEPLGMRDCWIGIPPEKFAAYGDRLAILEETDKPKRAISRYSTRRGATECTPGGNGHGSLHELVRFYEMLLGGGERAGVRLLQPESVGQIISRQRIGMFDETFKHVIDWGLGTILDSKRYGGAPPPYGFGQHASDNTFGHGGSQSSVGMADPAHGLALGCYFGGMPGEAPHQTRVRAVLEALYEDLGLVAA